MAKTPPAELESAILQALTLVEESLRAEAEAKSRLEAAQREQAERASQLEQQQKAQERSRLEREREQARSRAVGEALKSNSLPAPGVIPPKDIWPLPELAEDPSWRNPAILRFYNQSFGEADVSSAYRDCLQAAVEGDPMAMLVLAYAYEHWGDKISSSLSVLHPSMHNHIFWQRWALQLTSPSWVSLRLGDLSQDPREKSEHYHEAVRQGSTEAAYRLAMLEGRTELLITAAMGGHARSAAMVAFNLSQGTDGYPASPRLASAYWWRAALGGDPQALIVCSEYYSQGQGGFPKDDRRACLLALMAFEEAQRREQEKPVDGSLSLSGTAERHFDGLTLALGLSEYDIWQMRHELEIFKAAPREEMMSRLDELTPGRQSVIKALQAELYLVDDVLENLPMNVSEADVLRKMEEAMAKGNAVNELRRYARGLEARQSSLQFTMLSLLTLGLVLSTYLAVRTHLYSKIVRLVSVCNGSKA